MACVPIISFIFQTLYLIAKLFGGVEALASEERSKVYKVTTVYQGGYKDVRYENGDGSFIVIWGFVAIGYMVYYAKSIAEFGLHLLTNSWLMFFIPLFLTGFLSQFARSRLELALTTWKVGSTSNTSLLIVAARGCAGLVVIYPLIDNGFVLTYEWYELLIALVVIPFSSYYLLFRPLACSIIMTSAYYFFAPRNWRALFDPMNAVFAFTLYCCYLIYTGQTDNLVMLSQRSGVVRFDLYQLIGIGIFWCIIIAAQVGVCYGMWRVVGNSELRVTQRMVSLILTVIGGGLLFAILLKGIPSERMGRFTDMLTSIEFLVWLKPLVFWGYVAVSTAVFVIYIQRSWKNSLWGLISHVYIMLWIIVIFDIPEYSVWLDTYAQGLLSVLMISN